MGVSRRKPSLCSHGVFQQRSEIGETLSQKLPNKFEYVHRSFLHRSFRFFYTLMFSYVTFSFLNGFGQTKYQCNHKSPLYTNVKKLIFPHYDVIGEFPKMFFFYQKCDHKIYKISVSSQPIFTNYGLKWPEEPRAETVGSRFFDFWLFRCFLVEVKKINFLHFFDQKTLKKPKIKKSAPNSFCPRLLRSF